MQLSDELGGAATIHESASVPKLAPPLLGWVIANTVSESAGSVSAQIAFARVNSSSCLRDAVREPLCFPGLLRTAFISNSTGSRHESIAPPNSAAQADAARCVPRPLLTCTFCYSSV